MHFVPDDQDPYGIVGGLVETLLVTAPEWFKDTAAPEAEGSGIYAAVGRVRQALPGRGSSSGTGPEPRGRSTLGGAGSA